MTDYAITGKKGTGKSLFAIGLIREALIANKKVVTNIDIRLDELMLPQSKKHILRCPDKPTVADMEAVGRGQAGVIEDNNGIIILDESSAFLNARAWGDKERQPLLDWLIHSRKLGWDTYFISQGLEQIDKQMRTTQLEYQVSVKRTDKWPIPFITPLFKLAGLNVRFPKMHIGIYKQGMDRDSMIVDRKWFRSHDLYRCYDTQQLFLDRDHPLACGLHCILPAWHLKGRYLPEPVPMVFWFSMIWRVPMWVIVNISTRFGWLDDRSVYLVNTTPKHPLALLLAKLPPDQVIKHWQRLNRLGAFD